MSFFDFFNTDKQTQTTTVPDYIRQGYNNLVNQAGALPSYNYSGQLVPDLNQNQLQSIMYGQGLGQQGTNAFNQLSSNIMQGVGPTTLPQVGYASQYANYGQLLDPNTLNNYSALNTYNNQAQQVPVVNAQGLPNTNLYAYMNPYNESVVNTSLGALDQQRQRAIQSGNINAAASGAFGGSRQGVSDSLTNQAALQQAGQLSSQLYAQGFSQAQNAAQQDNALNLQAQGMNQNSILGQNQLTAGLAGQDNANQLNALMNNRQLQMGLVGLDSSNALSAMQSNQNAALAGSQLDSQNYLANNQMLYNLGLAGNSALSQSGQLQYGQQADLMNALLGQYGMQYQSPFNQFNASLQAYGAHPLEGTTKGSTQKSLTDILTGGLNLAAGIF